ncbi:MAG: 2-phospho-L-lactate guanylyltransferase [Nocardioides sp.]|nr:2-phospho-L-lactate guanylyltransferase [Nocardioides sp.]
MSEQPPTTGPGPVPVSADAPPPRVALVPVKNLAAAKSRLDVAPEVRRALAAAFATDTVAALLATPGVHAVVVVTDDEEMAVRLARLGAVVVPDPLGDLNDALAHAAAAAEEQWPGSASVALCADLPAASPRSLEVLLRLAPPGEAFVADAEGRGTTALLTPASTPFRSSFGPGSRDAHLAAGMLDLSESEQLEAGLRRDVDTLADLRSVLALGAGPATTAAAITAGLG